MIGLPLSSTLPASCRVRPSSYCNEIEPFAAAWLRNLGVAGLIPVDHVDERSIVDVQPADLDGFSDCHFFAGIGGWPLALELAGWIGPVWTGSCPCQPLSSAGKRKGHADERHLWPAFYRLIAECRPPVVFGEQVASNDGREWLAGVRADLEDLGYAVGAADLCAAGVGAPHIRQRLFWVADANGRDASPQRKQPSRKHGQLAADDGHLAGVSNSEGVEARPPKPRDSSGKANFGWSHGAPPTGRFVDANGLSYRIPEPFVPFVAHGVPGILDQISAAGNAIVPQVGAHFVASFMAAQGQAA